MKKIILILMLVTLLVLISGCSADKGVETKSTIVNKEEKYGNQYYFYVTYKIEGMEGDFEATIKIDKKSTYDSYDVGDEYIFYRPSSK